MACNREEAISELNGLLSLAAVRNSAPMLDGLSIVKNMLESVKKNSHKPIKQMDEKRYAKIQATDTYKKLDKNSQYIVGYTNLMREWLKTQTDAKIEEVGMIVDNMMNLQAGEYDRSKHTIKVAGKMTKEERIEASKKQLKTELKNQWDEALEKQASLLTEEQYEWLGKSIEDALLTDQPRIVVHELVHAVTVRFMATNPNNKATKRVKELYERVMQEQARIEGIVEDTNWSMNVDEFVAEGLSDPKFIEILANIDASDMKPLGMLQELIKAIVDMLKIQPKHKENVYEMLLDSVSVMMEEQNDPKTFQEGIDYVVGKLEAKDAIPDEGCK